MDDFLSLAFFDVADADQGIVLATYVDELGSDIVGTACRSSVFAAARWVLQRGTCLR